RVYAIGPGGVARTVARSGLPHGQDVGVESAGFVPPEFRRGWSAYLADRRVPGILTRAPTASFASREQASSTPVSDPAICSLRARAAPRRSPFAAIEGARCATSPMGPRRHTPKATSSSQTANRGRRRIRSPDRGDAAPALPRSKRVHSDLPSTRLRAAGDCRFGALRVGDRTPEVQVARSGGFTRSLAPSRSEREGGTHR